MKLGTIADLIEYRNLNESTVERVSACRLPTEFGEFNLVTYRDDIDDQVHFALTKGDIDPETPTLVRVHLRNTLTDVLLTDRSVFRSFTLHQAMQRIQEENGVLVILGNQETSESLMRNVKQFELEDRGEKPTEAAWKGTSRNVGIGSQILADLNVRKMRLMSSPTKNYHALSGFGLEIVEYVNE